MITVLNGIAVLSLGLVAGSFVALCAYRIPRALPVVLDVSRCDYCQSPLKWKYKLPLVSFLMLRGRSQCCGQPIPWRYPLVEAGAGILFLFLYYHSGENDSVITGMVFLALVLAGMLTDMERRLIPDKITITGMALGVLLAVLVADRDWWSAVLGLLICGGFLYLAGLLGSRLSGKSNAMGGGDVKFAAMIGAFLGWPLGLGAIILAATAGSGYGLIRARLRHHEQAREICFGPFLALGAVVALFWGESLLTWYWSATGWGSW